MGFLNHNDLKQLGLGSFGNNVFISDKASFYGVENIHIGNNVRIDDFCVLSAGAAGIIIGNYVHIAVYTSLIGQGKIILEDFSNISSRVSIYSSNDDYSGNSLTNPMVLAEFKDVSNLPVHICRHVIIGCGTVILPGVTIHKGAAVGALSLVNADCEELGIYMGVPCRKKSTRKSKIFTLEGLFLKE
jgi:acetyltransferase-like isoleucine patch superfamily enzyme